jgi:hypothetical protein
MVFNKCIEFLHKQNLLRVELRLVELRLSLVKFGRGNGMFGHKDFLGKYAYLQVFFLYGNIFVLLFVNLELT